MSIIVLQMGPVKSGPCFAIVAVKKHSEQKHEPFTVKLFHEKIARWHWPFLFLFEIKFYSIWTVRNYALWFYEANEIPSEIKIIFNWINYPPLDWARPASLIINFHHKTKRLNVQPAFIRVHLIFISVFS